MKINNVMRDIKGEAGRDKKQSNQKEKGGQGLKMEENG